jgi:hypothetical protein
MVRAGEPHGRAFYCCVLIFALLAAAMFTTEVFTGVPPSSGWRALLAVITLVFWCGVLVSFERLLRPDTARARSLALSPSARQTLNALCRMALTVAVLGSIGSVALHFIGGEWKDIATDIEELSGVVVFAAWCISDVCGEKLAARHPQLRSRPE